MGRSPRIHYSGALHHAIVRGNNRLPIFAQPSDQAKFEDLVEEGVDRFDHRIHSYCWMTNHAHLTVEVDQEPLSVVIHNLCSRYANWFNRKYSRSGHLFERRYRSGLIETTDAAFRVIRYIHLNPVRAGIVREPVTYPWSSHATYMGRVEKPWLETRWMLNLFGSSLGQARRSLDSYVSEGLLEDSTAEEPADLGALVVDERDATLSGDGAPNIERDEMRLPLWRLANLEEVLQVVIELEGLQLSDLSGRSQRRAITRGRALSAHLARECQSLTLAELAQALGRDPSTLGRAAEGVAKSLTSDPGLQERVEAAHKFLGEAILKRDKGLG